VECDNKVLFVSGGTGTFGQEFIKRCLKEGIPKEIIIFTRDELKQAKMKKIFSPEKYPLKYVIGDVRDKKRIMENMKGVDIVIHAAALKQIPICEENPMESVKTNILGTANVVKCASINNVEKFILLSSDKAVYPVNVYGSSKMCGEKITLNENKNNNKTKFSCVRYGNVIGSRGSIFTLFESQLKEGKIKVTDKDMTRFWLSKYQATQIVFDALNKMEGGEIFVPKLESCKIIDIVSQFYPTTDVEFIGIRKGEKIHECLLTKEESRYTKEKDGYYVIKHQNFRNEGETNLNEFEYTSGNKGYLLKKEEIIDFFKKRGIKC